MASGKKGIDKSIFVVLIMGIAGIGWVLYAGQSAAPPLPSTTMPAVFNAQYDGSVWQINDWLKQHAKNQASLKVLHWGKVESLDDGFMVHVKFEVKNAAGTEVVADKLFKLDRSGDILGMVDYKPKAP